MNWCVKKVQEKIYLVKYKIECNCFSYLLFFIYNLNFLATAGPDGIRAVLLKQVSLRF